MMKVGCQERAPVDMLMSLRPFKEMMNSIIEFSLPFHQLGWINFFLETRPYLYNGAHCTKERENRAERGWLVLTPTDS